MNNFYGDKTRWFIGVVEDNNDPMQLGRVRVRIVGIHSENQEDISTDDLPWAQVAVPATQGGVSGMIETTQLQPGANVVGFFFDGESSQLPFITSILSSMEYASGTQTGLRDNYGPNRAYGTGTGSTGTHGTIQPANPAAAGATNVETAYNFFLANGFTPMQSAGIVGNLMVESGKSLSTTIKAAGSEQSFGIAQWNAAAAAGNRLGQLKNFAQELGKPWTDLDVQLRFIIYELRKYPYLGLGALKSSSTIEAAVTAFEQKYERPSTPHHSKRVQYARDVYARFNK